MNPNEEKENLNIEKAGDESEIAGGVEFHKEVPIEGGNDLANKEISKSPYRTEVAGGVEFREPEEVQEKKESEDSKQKIGESAIHTMAQDMGNQVNQKQGVALQMILKQEREAKEARKKQEHNLILSLISIVLVAAGIGLVVYPANKEEEVAPVSNPAVAPSILYAENHTRIDATGALPITLISKIAQKMTSGETDTGEVTHMYLTADGISGQPERFTTRQFLTKTQSSIPGSLIPLLGNGFMLGTYSSSEVLPFLILQAPIANTLAETKQWEATMLQEFVKIFALDITDPDLYNKEFVDRQVQNKSLRALLDNEGNMILGYTYLDDNLLAIVTSQETITELLQRLATQF